MVRLPGSANDAIIAEVRSGARLSFVTPLVVRGQLIAALLPFVGVDPHEVRLLTVLQQGHPAADLGVAQDDRRRSVDVAPSR